MRRHIWPLALAATLAFAGSLPAQESRKVGILNSQEILERSVEGKRVFAELQAADKKYGDSLAKIDDQIKQLGNRLIAQRLTLTDQAAAAIQAEIQDKQTERQRAAEDATRVMRELQTNSLEKIQNELMPLIEQLLKDKGLDVILDMSKGGTVFSSPALDLTAELIKRYDALKAAPAAKK